MLGLGSYIQSKASCCHGDPAGVLGEPVNALCICKRQKHVCSELEPVNSFLLAIQFILVTFLHIKQWDYNSFLDELGITGGGVA